MFFLLKTFWIIFNQASIKTLLALKNTFKITKFKFKSLLIRVSIF